MGARNRKAAPDAPKMERWIRDELVVLVVDGDDGPFILMSTQGGQKGSFTRLAPAVQRTLADMLGVDTMDDASYSSVLSVVAEHFEARGFLSRQQIAAQADGLAEELGLL